MSLDIIKHYPVMLNEVTRYIQDNQTILDCTFGGGSYSNEILKKFKNNYVIAVDRDKNVIQFADSISKKYINRFSFNNITFSNIKDLKEFKDIDYFIFDLGVSHFQLKDSQRGFSFLLNGKIDMGMGLNQFNGYDLINNISKNDLKNILKYFGEESFAPQISNAIIKYRTKQKIKTTLELSEIINSVKFKKGKTNPATKSFQAIRMVVNQELSEIYKTLKYIIENGKINSKVIIVSFHSLEDLLVKRIMNFYGKEKSISRYVPEKQNYSEDISVKILTKKPIQASQKEVIENPSSRSAKLRVFQKISKPINSLDRKDLKMEKYFLLEDECLKI